MLLLLAAADGGNQIHVVLLDETFQCILALARRLTIVLLAGTRPSGTTISWR